MMGGATTAAGYPMLLDPYAVGRMYGGFPNGTIGPFGGASDGIGGPPGGFPPITAPIVPPVILPPDIFIPPAPTPIAPPPPPPPPGPAPIDPDFGGP